MAIGTYTLIFFPINFTIKHIRTDFRMPSSNYRCTITVYSSQYFSVKCIDTTKDYPYSTSRVLFTYFRTLVVQYGVKLNLDLVNEKASEASCTITLFIICSTVSILL